MTPSSHSLLEVASAIVKVGILFGNLVRSADSKRQLQKMICAVRSSPQRCQGWLANFLRRRDTIYLRSASLQPDIRTSMLVKQGLFLAHTAVPYDRITRQTAVNTTGHRTV